MTSHPLHPHIAKTIRDLEKRYPIVEHPLIRGIASRQFNFEQMHLIAERFFHVIKNFPRFLARMISHWDDTEARLPLVENLFEEHGRMDKRHIHVNTYVDFLKQVGLDTERITASRPTPATISYLNSVLHICGHEHINRGLSALGYIEDIVHQVSALIGTATKIEKPHLKNVSHFSEHEVLDDQHSKEIYDMLDLESEEAREHATYGLTMGAFFHYQLYENILSEVLFESGAARDRFLSAPVTRTQAAYPLKTGDAGKKRLDILNALYNQASLAFIMKQATKLDVSFLEFGCGTGRLSIELAERAPMWQLLALDNSASQIAVAKSSRHPTNLEFLHVNIDSLTATGKRFDIIYMRWVLIYQKNLSELFEVFSSLLNNAGLLIVEDNEPGLSGCFAPTHQRAVDNWQNFWTEAVSFVGQGPGFHERLCTAAQTAHLAFHDFSINQQLLKNHDEKELFLLGVLESKDAILQAGIPPSVFDDIANNAALIAESSMPVGFVRNFQLCFKKRGDNF